MTTSRHTRRYVDAVTPSSHSAGEVLAALDGSGEAAEASDADLETLRRALASLDASDIDRLCDAGTLEFRSALANVLGVRLDPRFVKRIGRAAVGPMRRRAAVAPFEVAELLFLPTVDPVCVEVLGDNVDDPTPTEVAAAADAVAVRFGDRVRDAYLMFLVAAQVPANPTIKEMLTA